MDLLRWAFREIGVIRVKSMKYHGEGVDHKETLFNVGEKLYFTAEIEEHDSSSDTWKPYIADDLQVELVMLDPWVRTTLVKGQGNNYHAEFYVFSILFRHHSKKESTNSKSSTKNQDTTS